MAGSAGDRVVDLGKLRRSCVDCSLRTLCLPAGLARTDMDQLDEVVQSRMPLNRGDALFRSGDPFVNLYVVRSGTVRTSQPGPAGDEQVIGFHLPGELVGLDAIAEARHHCEAVALERTSVCALPFDELQAVAARVAGLQLQFHRLISRELVQDQEHLMALGRRTARERVALFVHSLSERYHIAGYDGTTFRLAMSREDIANYLGLALETVSRLLGKLADEGMIDVDRRQLRIRDPQALADMAGRTASRSGARSRSAT